MFSNLKFILGLSLVICTFKTSSYSSDSEVISETPENISTVNSLSTEYEQEEPTEAHKVNKIISDFWMITQGNDKRICELGAGNLPNEIKFNLVYIMNELYESYREFTYPKWETIKDPSLWTEISEIQHQFFNREQYLGSQYQFFDNKQRMGYFYKPSTKENLQTHFQRINGSFEKRVKICKGIINLLNRTLIIPNNFEKQERIHQFQKLIQEPLAQALDELNKLQKTDDCNIFEKFMINLTKKLTQHLNVDSLDDELNPLKIYKDQRHGKFSEAWVMFYEDGSYTEIGFSYSEFKFACSEFHMCPLKISGKLFDLSQYNVKMTPPDDDPSPLYNGYITEHTTSKDVTFKITRK